MNTTYLDPERTEDLAAKAVVPVFPGDHDERTSGVGFLTEDRSAVTRIISDPETIMAVAIRLIQIADEIRENKARDRLTRAGIVDLTAYRGSDDPTKNG